MAKISQVLFAAGPGDIVGTYQHWVTGREDPSQVAMTYSGQFFSVCRDLGIRGYAISSNPRVATVDDGQFRVEHRPIPFASSSGVRYHIGQLLSGARLLWTAKRARCDVVVVADGTTHWFVLSLLPIFGIYVVPSLFCVLWPKFKAPSKIQALALKLARPFFSRSSAAILTMSDDIAKQVAELTRGKAAPIVPFLPTYFRSQFDGINRPCAEQRPFRVLFAGRIEENKGVFDILEIAKHLAEMGREDIVFDICGNGLALSELKSKAESANLGGRFTCHGHCNKATMREMYGACHVVIVPTRTDFVEGFNQVLVEAVLAGRPVVTSNVCPSLSYVRGAVLEVGPDDVAAYRQALLALCDDRQLYESKQQSCEALQAQFYNQQNGWSEALKSVLTKLQSSHS